VARREGPEDAPLARVTDAAGRPLGLGFHSPKSQIRVRLLGPGIQTVDRGFFAARLAEAVALRQAVLPAPAEQTTGYRLLNAEGDGVPGWTVDRFGDVLVSQITVAGLEALRGEAYAALGDLLPGCAILQMNDVPARRAEGLSQKDEAVSGDVPVEAPFLESGLHFTSELTGGQKTGFYCDQRENRRLAEKLAGGRTVLDLFAHSGAFGLYALRGGAEKVTLVESSTRLIDRGRELLVLNHLDPERTEWVKANVFEDLRQRTDSYGLVICDPPPLVRKRPDVDAAARAYKDLNRLALGRVKPGGFLLTFSCSGAVDVKLFRQIFFAAAVEARVRVALLQPLAAAPDHPVAITHPQGEYLKGWLAVVTGPV
jgi:23S rRNA (cytosine1962-C5)-methyltransferase